MQGALDPWFMRVHVLMYRYREHVCGLPATPYSTPLYQNAHPCDHQPGNSAAEGVLQHPLPAAVGLRPISTEIWLTSVESREMNENDSTNQ